MKSFFNGIKAYLKINLTPTAGDVSSPVDGDLWYNNTTGKFRKRENGTTSDLAGSSSTSITSGTAEPSGGSNGDIYLQYI